MRTDPRIIEFAKVGKISADLYGSYEIKVVASINLETNAVFKLVSTAFNNKGYRVEIPVSHPESTVKVMFTHPGDAQDINLVPLSNCTRGRQYTLKVDVIGKQKDFKNILGNEFLEKQLTIPCNLSAIVLSYLRSGKQINSFIIDKIVSNRYIQEELAKLSNAKEKLSLELICGLSIYNSAYCALDFNRNPLQEYELINSLKKVESEWILKQKVVERKILILEEAVRQKCYSSHCSGDSVVQIIAGSREESDIQHITEIQIIPQGGYFCKFHPLVNVKECRSDGISEQKNVFTENSSNVKFKVYQCYTFKDLEKSNSNIDGNKSIEQTVRFLKDFKNKYKIYNIYTIEISSCGYPNVVENILEKPNVGLTATLYVYPSDEYTFFFESLLSKTVSIKTAIHDKKKVRSYVEDNIFLTNEVKKQEIINDPDPEHGVYIENYSIYPNINIVNLSRINKGKKTTKSSKIFNTIDHYYQHIGDDCSGEEVGATNSALYRNNKVCFESDEKYVSALRQKLQTAFLNLSICYSQDYNLNFNVDVMTGNFLEKWGMKEFLDHTVFNWKKVISNLNIFQFQFKGEFAGFWGHKGDLFSGLVKISANGSLTHIDNYEKTVLNSSYRYYKKKSEDFTDIRLYPILHNDNAIFVNNVKKHGLEGDLERSFQLEEAGAEFEYSIKFPGIIAEIEHKNPLFKTSIYDKTFIREHIGGSLIEKSVLPSFHFIPWISLQNNYEITYGQMLKLANILKESIFYLYNIQNQVLFARLWRSEESSVSELNSLETWRNNLKVSEFDVNGILVRAMTSDEELNALSIENKQWHLLLDGVNRRTIASIPSATPLKQVYGYLKTCDENFILAKYEDLTVGEDLFNLVTIIMGITDLLEKKETTVLSIMSRLELEYKNMIELANAEKQNGTADSYNEMKNVVKTNFDMIYKELNISDINRAFTPDAATDIKTLLLKLNFPNNINLENLEMLCGSIYFLSEIVEYCINARYYWLLNKNKPFRLKSIFGP